MPAKRKLHQDWARFTIEDKELVWTDLQLPLYMEALAGELGAAIGAGYFNLPKAVGETVIRPWENYDAQWRMAARRCAEGVAAALSAGIFCSRRPKCPRAMRMMSSRASFIHGTAARRQLEERTMSSIGHVMILTPRPARGKTYALTNRFIRLLAHEAKPERIAALTFTRKAAGEFFDEILKKLARAAEDDTAAKKLAVEIEVPGMQAKDFLRLLRTMTDAMHRLNLRTLGRFLCPHRTGLSTPRAGSWAATLKCWKSMRGAEKWGGAACCSGCLRTRRSGTARPGFHLRLSSGRLSARKKSGSRLRLDAFLDEHAEVYLAGA